ncbi:uncharacterized protein BYT42DRAFT_560697 [Radiomyces spectabilis]|uniref:uncharacterized protein n=1 Tax=Radiomyces spectabilis TaxID=64574 RepID=UPI0022207D1D|nr:uncharacterized protein BYT42DRAFT_560697 [Radiomyces spectabilis]KAI8388617.1 hypothetical protein BYT42DRAFT_560697 [Radiomyces spectabilis]
MDRESSTHEEKDTPQHYTKAELENELELLSNEIQTYRDELDQEDSKQRSLQAQLDKKRTEIEERRKRLNDQQTDGSHKALEALVAKKKLLEKQRDEQEELIGQQRAILEEYEERGVLDNDFEKSMAEKDKLIHTLRQELAQVEEELASLRSYPSGV